MSSGHLIQPVSNVPYPAAARLLNQTTFSGMDSLRSIIFCSEEPSFRTTRTRALDPS
nr:MAG TPA: hypothetical protein [Caudoviricetes sp.]